MVALGSVIGLTMAVDCRMNDDKSTTTVIETKWMDQHEYVELMGLCFAASALFAKYTNKEK